MSGFRSMLGQGGRRGSDRRILVSWDPGVSGSPYTSKTSTVLYCAHFLDEPGISSVSGRVFVTPLLDLIDYFACQISFSHPHTLRYPYHKVGGMILFQPRTIR